MKQKDGLVLREVCGRAVLMSRNTSDAARKMTELSDTAAWLWKEAERQGEFSEDSLTRALCREYDVATDVARNDVAALLAQWRQEGLAAE